MNKYDIKYEDLYIYKTKKQNTLEKYKKIDYDYKMMTENISEFQRQFLARTVEFHQVL